MEPRDVTAGAWWFEALAWQGGGMVRAQMREVSPGVHRSDRPLPLHGDWKTLLRLHRPLHTMVGVPGWLWATGYAVTFAAFGLVSALIGAAYAAAARRSRIHRGRSAGRTPVGADA